MLICYREERRSPIADQTHIGPNIDLSFHRFAARGYGEALN